MAATNYDTNGVLTSEGWMTGTYNALNQPVTISTSATSMTFGYDPLGRCVKRTTSTSTTYLCYENWNLIEEGANPSLPDRIYVHGGRIDEIVADQAGGVWSYHHYDARGHCIILTDASGNLMEQYSYDAFGKVYYYDGAGNALTDSARGNRFLFTGREWLSTLRLYDYRNRLYLPELGRFIQPDPKEFDAGDYNLYRYCHNDPVNKTDPLGLRDVDVYVWEANIFHLSVGHIMVTEHDSQQVLLSQFPHEAGEKTPQVGTGPNTSLSFKDTYKEEGRNATRIITVHVPNDKTFDKEVKNQVSRPYWDKNPSKPNETHCARSTYDALKAGGVPLRAHDKGQILPGELGRNLDLMNHSNQQPLITPRVFN
jgi:RHS repeat-associated protein